MAAIVLASVASQLGDQLEREGRLGQRLDRQPHEKQRAVVGRGAVEVDHIAIRAAMNEDPLAVAANTDGDRLHGRAAFGAAVARPVVVEVSAPQAGRAVVAVRRSGRVEWYVEAAMAAAERVRTARGARPRVVALRTRQLMTSETKPCGDGVAPRPQPYLGTMRKDGAGFRSAT